VPGAIADPILEVPVTVAGVTLPDANLERAEAEADHFFEPGWTAWGRLGTGLDGRLAIQRRRYKDAP
jgi:hypothetical protein